MRFLKLFLVKRKLLRTKDIRGYIKHNYIPDNLYQCGDFSIIDKWMDKSLDLILLDEMRNLGWRLVSETFREYTFKRL